MDWPWPLGRRIVVGSAEIHTKNCVLEYLILYTTYMGLMCDNTTEILTSYEKTEFDQNYIFSTVLKLQSRVIID